MTVARLADESPAYRQLRDELQGAEMALRDQREKVAALRRRLPLDTSFDDVSFEEIRDGAREPVKLSELFTEPAKPLILMQFMYGKKQAKPCPMCTLWADGYDGVVPHLRQRANFAVLVAGDVAAFDAYARSRGWRHLRAVSAADCDLKRRLGFENAEGEQLPGVSVFVRRPDGSLVHAYSQSAWYGAEEFRGMDLLSPLWHFLDLTPEGREDWMPRRRYE